MTANEVRVRFAPSPTGSPHIGNIRNAVFDWLYTRHTGGKFLLRIEDTDRNRLVPGAIEEIMYDLRWLGIEWDEGPDVGGAYGPYLQSERLELYQKHAAELVEKGLAYHCYCSAERLSEMRKEQEALKQHTGYDRRCRDLSPDEAERLNAESGGVAVIRFKMPLTGTTVFHDYVRGDIAFENNLQDDFVILKSDGFPTYHFASIVDDHNMRISHVIRSEEWLSSGPKHVQLYNAFGWEPPVFVHPPLIVGPDRAKLSKRHGSVAFSSYIEEGYLPEAILNFLALLGWSAGEDRDLYNTDELVEKFTLEGITSHPAIFDLSKLQWMNGQYIRSCEIERLVNLALPYLQRAALMPESPTQDQLDYVNKIIELLQERLHLLSEAPEMSSFFFADELDYDPKAVAKWFTQDYVLDLLALVASKLESVYDWNVEGIEAAVRLAGEEAGVEGGKIIHPVRVATTGRTVGPGLFETLEVLGRERVVSRLRRSAEKAAQGGNLD
ncbi:MAG: glutamate--tRNA ligase [Armatimonadota bacterium]|nr:glutamate--tRNA ligase [Armatimonadota bacterium]